MHVPALCECPQCLSPGAPVSMQRKMRRAAPAVTPPFASRWTVTSRRGVRLPKVALGLGTAWVTHARLRPQARLVAPGKGSHTSRWVVTHSAPPCVPRCTCQAASESQRPPQGPRSPRHACCQQAQQAVHAPCTSARCRRRARRRVRGTRCPPGPRTSPPPHSAAAAACRWATERRAQAGAQAVPVCVLCAGGVRSGPSAVGQSTVAFRAALAFRLRVGVMASQPQTGE